MRKRRAERSKALPRELLAAGLRGRGCVLGGPAEPSPAVAAGRQPRPAAARPGDRRPLGPRLELVPNAGSSLVGCACAAATLRAVCARSPFDAVFEVRPGGPRVHCVWMPVVLMSGAGEHAHHPLAWAALMASLGAWTAEISAVALYTNGAELRAYQRRWRAQWGQTRIVGAPVEGTPRAAAPAEGTTAGGAAAA
ncbi:unnamed protein product [Prorocentrum cordatum]|uniref:Uncharacterized protein n=1 Tax=Prorocentrum cordatum TaxID=2364126 RepID=A0ABN9TA06_9DINO|nr:unnamed protein product [Polarella glacialis]